jgi:hypothetical protein
VLFWGFWGAVVIVLVVVGDRDLVKDGKSRRRRAMSWGASLTASDYSCMHTNTRDREYNCHLTRHLRGGEDGQLYLPQK